MGQNFTIFYLYNCLKNPIVKLKTISTKEFKCIRFKESLKTERSIFKTNTISVYIKTTVRQQTLFFVC